MNASKVQTLLKDELLALARKGRSAWNEWASRNPGAYVDLSGVDFHDPKNREIDFEAFEFPGLTNFRNSNFLNAVFSEAKFHDSAKFGGAKFDGTKTEFNNATFGGEDTSFRDCKFNSTKTHFRSVKFHSQATRFSNSVFSGGNISFREAEFVGKRTLFIRSKFGPKSVSFRKSIFKTSDPDFSDSEFGGPLNFQLARFSEVPDFRRTQIAAHFTFDKISVGSSLVPVKGKSFLSKAKDSSAADKFRRLKELAIVSKDHDREQNFFAGELVSKRFHETHGVALVLSYLYEWTSNFGRSVARPFGFLIFNWLFFGIFYFASAESTRTSSDYSLTATLDSLANGLRMSVATLFPFITFSRKMLSDAKTELFDGSQHWWIDLFSFTEALIGLALVFLVGLALRNRFRI
jgi:uncharacterized protein YjbI with pentapeptide repeats